MPQLDKYIFFNQIISLTIFFFLIYIYVLKTLVPKLSAALKYRRLKMKSWTFFTGWYNDRYLNCKSYYRVRGKKHTKGTLSKLYETTNYVKRESFMELNNLYQNMIKLESNDSYLINFINKTINESNRVKKLLK